MTIFYGNRDPIMLRGYNDEEEAIYDEWGYHQSLNVSVDFLLPTGIYIPMDVPRNSTIREMKAVIAVFF